MTRPRLFTIPPGVAFLQCLAQSLCDGSLIEGFCNDHDDPLVLSAATIYLPTRRAARALRSEFVDLLGGRSAILPSIKALGNADDDAGFFDEEQPVLLDLLPPVGSTHRLLELARLIIAWKRCLPESVSEIHGENRLIAPASPADAVWLARGLAELLDAMDTEERAWSELDGLVAANHAQWWQLTLEFLKIAGEYWPARLAELHASNPADHRNAVLRVEAERMRAAPPSGPVIVAGSTGSIPATAELMATVAQLDKGAVVLPGLDQQIDEAAWMLVGGNPAHEHFDPASCAHPQYGLYRLLQKLQADRDDVVSLADSSDRVGDRNQLVSTAMMPAAATADWALQSMQPNRVAAAFEHVELIEAASEREEALSIAVAMRLAAQPEGDAAARNVALVTPGRTLARRVAGELQRFDIEADDSGGRLLALSPQATLLELALETAFGARSAIALVALMKHPLVRFGLPASSMRRAARLIERVALRGGTGTADIGALAALFDRRLSERQANLRHAPHWQKRLDLGDIALARSVAHRIEEAFAVLLGQEQTELTVCEWAEHTGRLLEEIARDESGSLSALWESEAGERLAAFFGDLLDDRSSLACTAQEWVATVPSLLGGEMVKPRSGGHPHIFIWGALEARLQRVDTIILAGLNEGTWPGAVSGDPFLSRAMKAAIGLDPPERRIGLAAHDVQMGLGTPHVVLSRSARSQNAPTVASRWLQRLQAVVGTEETERMRLRGGRYLRWAGALDRRKDRPIANRPSPKPPADRQPRRYSFSEVKTLRRDPYAIYARRILQLDAPEPLVGDPGPAERGTLYHRILECFTREVPDVMAPEAGDRLAVIADREFAETGLPVHIALVWRHQFAGIADAFLNWERGRNADIIARHTEHRARYDLPSGLTLSGIADRIDLRTDSMAEIIDYKTGSSPSRKVARTLLDPQLPLESAALSAGAFDGLEPLRPASLSYIRLRPAEELKVDRIDGKSKGEDGEKSAIELGDEAVSQLTELVDALAQGGLGFTSQVIPDPQARYGRDYDHLARLGEWSSVDADDTEGTEQ
ncbi:MAG: double-strand break repair protein AddB [Rhodospirillales bacterium]|nr:double-strand break repair protein AddB [Rhodospirillales bacterium]